MTRTLDRLVDRLAYTSDPKEAALMLFESFHQAVTECVNKDERQLIKVLSDYDGMKSELLDAVFGVPSPAAEAPPNIMNEVPAAEPFVNPLAGKVPQAP